MPFWGGRYEGRSVGGQVRGSVRNLRLPFLFVFAARTGATGILGYCSNRVARGSQEYTTLVAPGLKQLRVYVAGPRVLP